MQKFGCFQNHMLRRVSISIFKERVSAKFDVAARRIISTGPRRMNQHTWSSQDEACARAVPKIELHLHLDGSLSPGFIAERAKHRGINLPVPTDQLQSWLMVQKKALMSKDFEQQQGKNWPTFDFCNQFLQTSEELTAATTDLLSRLANENVRYAEIRFCPALHTLEGLTSAQAVEAVILGYRSQEAVLGGVIICALRSKTEDHGIEMAKLAGNYLQRSSTEPVGVVGFDIAGDEGRYPLASPKDPMVAGCRKAKELGVPITIHAGEFVVQNKFDTGANIRYAIELGARRIGHGIALGSDDQLMNKVKNANITVEVCLTANVGNGYKVRSFAEHPVKKMVDAGVAFSLSSDNLLLSGDAHNIASPTAEIVHLVRDVGLGWGAVRDSLLCGAAAAFSPAVGKSWVEGLQREIDSVLSNVCSDS